MKKIMENDEYTLVQYSETDFEVTRRSYEDVEIYMSTYGGDVEVKVATVSVGPLSVEEYIKHVENLKRVAEIAKTYEEIVLQTFEELAKKNTHKNA